MASMLSALTGAANKGSDDLDVFQKGVEQNKVATENLLTKGRASGKVSLTLVSFCSLNVQMCSF